MQNRRLSAAALAACALAVPFHGQVYADSPRPATDAAVGDVAFQILTKPRRTGTIIVKKVVISDAGYTAPPNAVFAITVSCHIGSEPPTNKTVTLAANGLAFVQTVPVGSTCTASEQVPGSVAYSGTTKCPSGVGWLRPTIAPNPLSPTTTGNMTLTITNRYGCLSPTGSLTVEKSTVNQVSGFTPPPWTFTMTLQCPNWPLLTATVVNGVAQFNGVPAGVSCTVGEEPPPGPYPTSHCWTGFAGWWLAGISPNPVVVPANGSISVGATNIFMC